MYFIFFKTHTYKIFSNLALCLFEILYNLNKEKNNRYYQISFVILYLLKCYYFIVYEFVVNVFYFSFKQHAYKIFNNLTLCLSKNFHAQFYKTKKKNIVKIHSFQLNL
jgi:hypothetical protein